MSMPQIEGANSVAIAHSGSVRMSAVQRRPMVPRPLRQTDD